MVPPDFLLDTTIAQVESLRVDPDKAGIVVSLAKRAKEKGLSDQYATRAARLYGEKIAPALARQVAALKQVRAGAVHDAGVWRFKDGPGFYAANLRYTTTTDMTPEEVHKMGLDQAAEINAKLDVLLKAQGLTQGGVGERIQALYKDPRYLYANTDAGKAELLDYLQHPPGGAGRPAATGVRAPAVLQVRGARGARRHRRRRAAGLRPVAVDRRQRGPATSTST